MNENSIEAYRETVKPELNKRQKEVLRYIEQFPGKTMSEIAQIMNRPVNTISGRFKELKDKGRIAQTGNVIINGRKNAIWTIVYERKEKKTD